MDLLKSLIIASEKAANIARILRQHERLFENLIEQKDSSEANPNFRADFKTLADVLIQQMVKHDVGNKFPSIKNKIQGEENCHFCNRLGENFEIEVKENKEQTAKLLSEIMEQNEEIAEILAEEVHKNVIINDVHTKVPDIKFEVNLEQMGIWIDPIDGTNEYIRGRSDEKCGEFYLKGLNCVTVLIGVYSDKGEPIIGVINQPFYQQSENNRYQCQWGVCYENKKMSSVDSLPLQETNIICVGNNENKQCIQMLEHAGFQLVYPRGAGYKLLTVVLGFADAYILSKPTTYFWDTCAPHAILRSLEGDIIHMENATLRDEESIKYGNKDSSETVNGRGIIAYKNKHVLEKLMRLNWPA